MLNSISFTSTYKVKTNADKKELRAFDKFEDLCAQKEGQKGVYTKFEDKMESEYPYNWSAVRTLVVPAGLDDEVESYCALRGIEFKKYNTYKLLDLDSINSRIEKAPKNMISTYVNAAKLEELLQTQDSNFAHCKDNYDKYYFEDTDFMIKSADKIPAPTLRLIANSNSSDFDINKLTPKELSILLTQQTNNPEHCLYFAFKELGMNEIPIYTDKESYKIGRQLGIFE